MIIHFYTVFAFESSNLKLRLALQKKILENIFIFRKSAMTAGEMKIEKGTENFKSETIKFYVNDKLLGVYILDAVIKKSIDLTSIAQARASKTFVNISTKRSFKWEFSAFFPYACLPTITIRNFNIFLHISWFSLDALNSASSPRTMCTKKEKAERNFLS